MNKFLDIGGGGEGLGLMGIHDLMLAINLLCA